jgi:hypothetical protein
MFDSREVLETRLNDFDPAVRRKTLTALMQMVQEGAIRFPEPRPIVNMHAHTFFSFNGYGYSPTCLAWKARCEGLLAAGVVDFDVLDAVDEFLEACEVVGIRGCAGLETRIFVPEFETREINSPGEPGIMYYMGAGFTSSTAPHMEILERLRETAGARTRAIVERVNPYLDPVVLNYEQDVLPLTPKGNATERHVCMAYQQKGAEIFPQPKARAAFWAAKLGQSAESIEKLFAAPPSFQRLIRSKLMKRGGVGYVQPKGPDFPRLEEVNRLILEAGAIPTIAWLNGLTEGEQAIDELLDLLVGAGAAALNIIPDRNWNVKDAEEKKAKVGKLHEVVAKAHERGLPLLAGTEMNAHGQRFVDDFAVPEMEPLRETFLNGAYVFYAHTVLQRRAQMGYLSQWAERRFPSRHERNAFFAQLGRRASPEKDYGAQKLNPQMTAETVLEILT